MVRRVDREMVLLAGGGAALLMQLAHPKVAAAVDDSHQFPGKSRARLRRTVTAMWSLSFDETAGALQTIEHMNAVHAHVKGFIKDGEALPPGTPYEASDPAARRWVQATLEYSTLLAYDLFVGPLTSEEKARYYEETRPLDALLNLPEAIVPRSFEAFGPYLERLLAEGTLGVGPTARRLARHILHPAPLELRLLSPVIAFVTIGLLPPTLRKDYGFRWSESHERWFQLLARWVRRLLPLIPPVLRIVPKARAADGRLASRAKPQMNTDQHR